MLKVLFMNLCKRSVHYTKTHLKHRLRSRMYGMFHVQFDCKAWSKRVDSAGHLESPGATQPDLLSDHSLLVPSATLSYHLRSRFSMPGIELQDIEYGTISGLFGKRDRYCTF